MPDSVTASSPWEGAPEAQAGPHSPLVVDEARREAFWRGQPLDLSPTELAVLAYLLRRAGQTVTYDALLQDVWGTALDEGGSLWQVRSTVKRLRQKLVAVADHSCQLVSIRSIGYRLDLPADPSAPPSHRPIALRVALVLVVAALLAVLAAGWTLAKQARGDPTALVWYRQQRVPVGVLWALGRGQHCAEGPDGALYCFDTPEERAAALDVLLGSAAPQEQDELGATPEPQPQGK